MTGPGGPGRRGRHSSGDDGAAGLPPQWTPGSITASGGTFDAGHRAGSYRTGFDTGGFATGSAAFGPAVPGSVPGHATGGFRRVSGLLDRFPDDTGPVAPPGWWSYGSSDHPDHPLNARHSSGDSPGDAPREHYHPSAPLPPRPPGVWDRLRPRESGIDEDAATVARPRVTGWAADAASYDEDHQQSYEAGHEVGDGRHSAPEDDRTDAHHLDSRPWEDQTGGLEVIGAHVGDDASRRGRWRRKRRAAGLPGDAHADHGESNEHAGVGAQHGYDDGHDDRSHDGPAYRDLGHDDLGHDDLRHDDLGHDDLGHDDLAHDDLAHDDLAHDDVHFHDDDIPVVAYDPHSLRRRRRRPIAVLLTLLVLGGLVAGIVIGGEKLLSMINPSSRDFTGQGSGTVEVRISQGDTLSDIARTLVDGGVIASIGPFVDAAESEPAATGIQPGVYRMREQMSGRAAVDLLLDPATRLVSRVTLPEGLTVQATLTRLAESTGTPIEELNAAAADPAALGLPAYAGGKIEGFLFPATYDFEPDTTAVDMLKQMVARAVHALDDLQIPADQRLVVVTKASLVQAEASTTEDMGKVARVLENRLADGMPLQLDSTVNYANGKSGITTTPADRANPSPYNTYVHPGLPPGAIDNPGEAALRAVLAPTPGEWRFFVVVDPDTGDTRFAVTGAEHQQNVLLFQQWLRAHPGG